MPGRNDSNTDVVTISGKTEDSVYECANYLREQEENYIEELIDRGLYKPDKPDKSYDVNEINNVNNQEVEITGAPWQIDNMEQFPAMGVASNLQDSTVKAAIPTVGGVWGQRRW